MARKRRISKMFSIILGLSASLAVYLIYPERKLPDGAKIDYIKVIKSKHQLSVFQDGTLLKTYKISLGGDANGHKRFEGDNKTPEGKYTITAKNPNSGYHKNLGVSYPNRDDLQYAKLAGKAAGGDIKIHGLRNGLGFLGKLQRLSDWTAGCIALTNTEIDELYSATSVGTTIEIFP